MVSRQVLTQFPSTTKTILKSWLVTSTVDLYCNCCVPYDAKGHDDYWKQWHHQVCEKKISKLRKQKKVAIKSWHCSLCKQ